MLFAGLKLLETRSHRDAAAAAFLGYFLIITNFLYTQTIPTAALMCAAVFGSARTLVGFSAPHRAPRANLRTAALLLAHAAPAALALFLLFPRVQGPLWGLPQDAYSGMTGLSDTMSPGTLSSLAQSDAIAFRAEFEGEPPAQRLRYWRGPGDVGLRRPHLDASARATSRSSYRRAAGAPRTATPWCSSRTTATGCSRSRPRRSLPERARMSFDGQVIATSRCAAACATSSPRSSRPTRSPRRTWARCAGRCALPPGFNPRALALAARMARRLAPDDGGRRARHRLPAPGPLRVYARAAAARRATRWTSSCSRPAPGSASTSPRRSSS